MPTAKEEKRQTNNNPYHKACRSETARDGITEKYKEGTEQHGNWLSWGVQKMKQLDSNRGQATEPRDRAAETGAPPASWS